MITDIVVNNFSDKIKTTDDITDKFKVLTHILNTSSNSGSQNTE